MTLTDLGFQGHGIFKVE